MLLRLTHMSPVAVPQSETWQVVNHVPPLA